MTPEEWGRLLGGLYSYAHGDNEVAAYVFESQRVQGKRVTTGKIDDIVSAEQRKFFCLMENVVELAEWWKRVQADVQES